jgi:hypothetical protein
MAANAPKIKGAKSQEEYDKYMKIGRELTAKLKELNIEAGV